jgi:hypothetical protein
VYKEKMGWGGGLTPPPSSSQNNPNISKVTTCSEKGGGMDEIWGRGQKIYKNHIQFDPRKQYYYHFTCTGGGQMVTRHNVFVIMFAKILKT